VALDGASLKFPTLETFEMALLRRFKLALTEEAHPTSMREEVHEKAVLAWTHGSASCTMVLPKPH
jgi:hypothetical protein